MASTPVVPAVAPRTETLTSDSSPLMWLLAALFATLLWDWSGLDLDVMQLLGTAQGFGLRNQWLMERVLHEAMRQLATVIYLLLWVWALWPERWNHERGKAFVLPRRERLALLLLVTFSMLAVSLVKRASLTSCPWELQTFGGPASYVSHWDIWTNDGGSGHCFPGGHASSAFGFLALCLPWLAPIDAQPRPRNLGMRMLALILIAGFVAGTVQTLRGAHYPSHTLWTLVICAAVSLGGWRASRRWLRPVQVRNSKP
jgi:membrane-associated PAP2 superfamily phosphatase